MGVRALYDPIDRVAVMYDSVTETAFGPLFHDEIDRGLGGADAICAFVEWLGDVDARTLRPRVLERRVFEWLGSREIAYLAALDRDNR